MLALREGAKELNHEHFHGYVIDGMYLLVRRL
jgi:hypothetical protein